MERSKYIFGNEISKSIYKKAVRKKKSYLRKFGDDAGTRYILGTVENKTVGKFLGIKDIVIGETAEKIDAQKGIVIGNIRMGFGHYRIAMAIASAAAAKGYIPYWFDISSYSQTTGGKIIAYLNKLYTLGSKIAQKSSFFNKTFWETMNRGGYKRLSVNAIDQKVSELMSQVYLGLPTNIPFAATHVWTAQAAIHAGLKKVVNVMPDNCPIAFNLAEGSIHTVQTPSAFLGYKMLSGMDKRKILAPIPEGDLYEVGHYIDHEIVANIENDCAKRLERIKNRKAKRILLTVGGAGAQKEMFSRIIKEVMPLVRYNRAVLYINVGDHKGVWDGLCADIPELSSKCEMYFDQWEKTCDFAEFALNNEVSGIHAFKNDDIFAAVYTTNLLMRSSDILITKPSELAFYPVPKLLIKRIGGHEAWGAIRASEIGDGTIEFDSVENAFQMLGLMLERDEILTMFCDKIIRSNKLGIYNGAYRVVELAANGRLKIEN